MDTTNALVTTVAPSDEDMQVIGSWLLTKQSENTRRAYRRIALALLSHSNKPLQDITIMDTQAYIATVDGENSTVALVTNCIKSLFTFTSQLQYTLNIGKLLTAPKSRSKLPQRILTETEVIRMIDRETSQRNHAMLRLMYHAGLRVSEVVNLKWEDVRETGNGAVLDVWGKGEKQRYISISADMYRELRTLNGQVGSDRYVFQSRESKAGTLPMDTSQVDRIVLVAAKRAGIDKHVSAHWLRHAHASHALDNGAPIQVVQDTLGHASLVTTTRYAHIKPGTGSSQYIKG